MATLTTPTKLKLAYAGIAAPTPGSPANPTGGPIGLGFVTKPLLMPTLAASLATRLEPSALRCGRPRSSAQAGGWGGDVALLGKRDRPFIAGTGSFALGHLAYLGGFVRQRSNAPGAASPAARAVAMSWALTAPAMGVMARRKERGLGRSGSRLRHDARHDGGGGLPPRSRALPRLRVG